MSADIKMIQFLKKLPSRERNFYLLMRSYDRALFQCKRYDVNAQSEAVETVAEFFEGQIDQLLGKSVSSPIYDIPRPRDEKAEKSIIEDTPPKDVLTAFHDQKLAAIRSIDKGFDDKLGAWASSFSKSGDEITSDATKRLSNESDLSSDEDENPEKE